MFGDFIPSLFRVHRYLKWNEALENMDNRANQVELILPD